MPSEWLGAFRLADLPCFDWRFVVGRLPHMCLTLASDPPLSEAFVSSIPRTGPPVMFDSPSGVAVDSSGTVYVAEARNHCIRKVTSSGEVTTLAGSGTDGFADGLGAAAEFASPTGVAVDASGTVYVADSANHRIRKITPSGEVTTFAGSDKLRIADGKGAAAGFAVPVDVAVDASGTVYVADLQDNRIRKVTPSGEVTTLAGNGAYGSADGPGASARFDEPTHVAVDASGTVYVADQNCNRIRKITSSGVVSTWTRSDDRRFANGTRPAEQFEGPMAFDGPMAVDAGGMVYVGYNNCILKVTPSGQVTTLAGSGAEGFADGTGAAAKFCGIGGLALDAYGTVYVADYGNNRIRKVAPSGEVTTLAGNGEGDYADGTGTTALVWSPRDVAVDASGTVYVADPKRHCIRKATPSGEVTTLAGGEVAGLADGTGAAAKFAGPSGVAVDASGTVYVADSGNDRIRKVTPSGKVTTLAGRGERGFADGKGASARFRYPGGVAVDASGTVYVADSGNNRIRKVTPSGQVTTLAGRGEWGFADGKGASARFWSPRGVAVDASGTVYVADSGNNRIRKVTPSGQVTTLAGRGESGFADGAVAVALFSNLKGVAVDASGTVYVADHHVLRVIR
jgi:streptogramin lyase